MGEGKIVCRDGWQFNMCNGPMCAYLETKETFCNVPICSEGCHPRTGYCETPDECLCRTGWQGNLCDECVPYPGCDTTFGSCEDPWECNCSYGYTGTYCNETISVK